jgi:hypothetical protein
VRDELGAFGHGLGHEHAVEGIAVMPWEVLDGGGVVE